MYGSIGHSEIRWSRRPLVWTNVGRPETGGNAPNAVAPGRPGYRLDVPSLVEGRTALARADELASRDALRALRKRVRELEDDDAADLRREYLALASARGARSPLSPEELLDKLGVASLRQRVASGDSLERSSAARRLSNVAAFISFYEPRAFLQQDQPLRAAVSLRAAASIAPLRGESCDLARRAAERLPPDEARRLPPCS